MLSALYPLLLSTLCNNGQLDTNVHECMNNNIISNHIKNWQSPIITNTYWTYQTYPLAVSYSIHSSIQEIRPCASPEVEYLNVSTSEFSCWFMSFFQWTWLCVLFPVKYYGLQFLSSILFFGTQKGKWRLWVVSRLISSAMILLLSPKLSAVLITCLQHCHCHWPFELLRDARPKRKARFFSEMLMCEKSA